MTDATSHTMEQVLSRLDGVKRSGRGWMARCPAHPDGTPSLSIGYGEDRVLLYCHAQCRFTDILTAIGFTAGELMYGAMRTDRSAHVDLRARAGWLEDHALTFRIKAEAILRAATGVSIDTLNDSELDRALGYVADAYEALEWAKVLDDVACVLRNRAIGRKEHRAIVDRAA